MARNFVQEGDTLNLTPSVDVAAGTGHLLGAALFGVALVAPPFLLNGRAHAQSSPLASSPTIFFSAAPNFR